MNKVLSSNLKEGMVVAENVITKTGQCILEKGKVLNRQIIMRLSFYNIDFVMVEDDEPVNADVTPSKTENEKEVSGLSKLKALMNAKIETLDDAGIESARKSVSLKVQTSRKIQTFQVEHTIALSVIKSNFENYVYNGIPLDVNAMLAKVNDIFVSCKTSLELFNMLHSTDSSEDSIYNHALNVALICRQTGKWLKFSDADTDVLTLSGLLHDIGKLKIPTEILNKPGKYTDEEFNMVKAHPQLGYDLLKSLPIDSRIMKSALSHHERCDGSGYPAGLTLDFTADFAMIVAIADVYDAMTAARAYRAPLCAFQVIENFEKEGLQKYNPKYILTFLNHIANTYQNHRVILSDGRSATVVMINNNQLSRPIVSLDDGTCVDLSTESNLTIQKVL